MSEEKDSAPSQGEKLDDKPFEFPPLHADEPVTPTPSSEPAAPAPSPDQPPSPKVPLVQKIKAWFAANKKVGLVISFVLAGVLMWGISKIRHGSSAPEETAAPSVDEIPVNVIEARFGRFQDEIKTVGSLKGEAEIELRFEVDGTIVDFGPAEGAKISKGQVIARLNDRDAKLKVQHAQNELEQMEKLFSLGGISKTKLDEARLNMDVAQTELDKTRVVATRDGILGDKAADVGEFVTPQRKIATLVAIRNVVVKVGIIEQQVDKVYPGQKILVTVDAYPGNVFEGTIASISPLITGTSKTFEITAKIPNPNSLLLPGMFARTRIITYEADDAISVPNDALIKTAGGFQVLTVSKENVAVAKDVEVGFVATDSTQIRSGLEPGEVVIVQRPPELKAGSKVKVIEVQKQNP